MNSRLKTIRTPRCAAWLILAVLAVVLRILIMVNGAPASALQRLGITEQSRVGRLIGKIAPQTFASKSTEAAQGEAALKLLKDRGEYASLQKAMETARYRANAEPQRAGQFAALNPAQEFHSRFTPQGLEVRRRSDEQTPKLAMTLRGVGYGNRQLPVSPGTVTAQDQRIEIHRTVGDNNPSSLIPPPSSLIPHPSSLIPHPSSLTEWYINRPNGLEQGFTINEPPGERAAGERLRLTLELSGEWRAKLAADGQAVEFSEASGGGTVRYDHLAVRDAAGNRLPARMSLSRNELRLEVEDAGAVWPVTIDPTLAQQAYLKASNAEANDRFGRSVAISGNTVVVGAVADDSNATGVNGNQANNSATDSGAVFVFVRSGATWTQQAYLKASNTGAEDRFGLSVAISGDTVVVSADLEDSNAIGINGGQADDSAQNAGAAYVFVRSGVTWTQQAYLKASNTNELDRFGSSVGVSGDTVVVGAYFEDSGATGVNGDQGSNWGQDSGAAYVFVRSGATWTQQAYLKASDSNPGDNFGWSVAVSGETVVVGAHNEDSNATGVGGDGSNNSVFDSGAVFVFVRSGVTWAQQAYLKASNTGLHDYFGQSVAVSGDTVVVGADGEDSNATGVNGNQADNSASGSGAAYVFVRSGVTWTQQAYFKASNTGADDNFGGSVAVWGNTIMVGARQEDSNATGVGGDGSDNSAADAGAAYTFVRSGAIWTQQDYLKAPNTDVGDSFGISVAVSGDTVVVGAYFEDSSATGVNGDGSNDLASDSGAVYIFTTNTPPGITAQAGVSRQQGSAVSNSTIATVSDAETAAGSLTVTVTSSNPSNGVTISNIVNTNGTITANIVADCTASNAAFTLQVSDGSLTATATLNVTVTAATAPTTSNAGPDQLLCATAPATLAANTPTVGTGAWSVVSGPSLSIGQFNSLTNPAATFTPVGGVGAYTLRWTITGACATSTNDVVLTYNALPTITLSASPSVIFGATSANLPYTATTGSPNQYSIDYNAAANTAGFADVTNASLTASPIALTVPGAAAPATYNATLTVRNSTTGCVSSSTAFTVTISNCPSLFTVNNTGDGADATPGNGVCATAGGVCTLRAAIQEANALTACSPITITITATGTITLTSALPDIAHPNLTINGPGANQLTVSGNNTVRVFQIGAGNYNVTLAGLTIANGRTASLVVGGGLRNLSTGTVNVNQTTVSGNSVGLGASGGGISQDGSGTLNLNDSAILNNSAQSGGGGIDISAGTLNVTNCTLSGNTANFGGGARDGIGTTINFINSTITGNSVTQQGGGVYRTFGTVRLKNTIVAGNTAGASDPDVSGFYSSQGNNLIGTVGTALGFVGSDLLNVSALLGTLGNYGGTTNTVPLLPGSPAINAGNNTGAPAADQRGIARPQQSTVDIGAFESRGFTLSIGGGNNQSTNTNANFANPLVVGVSNAFGEPFNGGRVTFTPPGSGASATVAGSPATISSGTATSGTVTANGMAGGPYTVTAAANGVATGVNFSLTNVTPSTTVSSINRVSANPACEGASVSWTVTFAASVTGVTASNFSLVGGTGANITGVTGSGTTWTVTATTGTVAATLGLNMVNSTGISLSISNLPFTGQTYTVNDLPTAANAGPDQMLCATSATLAANSPTAGTGSWSIISGAGGSFVNAANPTTTFNGTAGTAYTLRWTISNSPCTASTDDVVITLRANPTVANAGPDQAFCGTSAATLAANTPTVGAGAWTIVSGPSALTSQFSSLSSPTATFTPAGGTGTYTLRWTISNSPCTASTDDVTLTYNVLPTITLGANPSVLPGVTSANLTYSATTGSPNQYSIDYDAAANTAGFADVTNVALTASPIVLTVPGAAAVATYNATLTVRNSTTGCVSSSTAFTVTISSCLTVLTVNNTGDGADATPGDGVCATGGGVCTLRAAIQEANALTGCAGSIAINFNIAGAGVQTITVGTQLPDITRTVAVDGCSQPGAVCSGFGSTLLIQLTQAGGVSVGLNFVGANSSGSLVRGLVVNGFQNAKLQFSGSNNTVQCNFIGTNAAGSAEAPISPVAGKGLIFIASSNNLIGTNADGVNDANEGNVISGNKSGGLNIQAGGGANIIAGNRVGTDVTGMIAVPNASGSGVSIAIASDNNRIGGPAATQRNLICSASQGILFQGAATGNKVQGNYIGMNVAGTLPLPNAAGIHLGNTAHHNLIGTDGDGVNDLTEGNLISGNDIAVAIFDTANNNTLAGNLIGVQADGVTAVGNSDQGINIHGSASNNTIGGTAANTGNVIAFYTLYGISISGTVTGNRILGNRMFGNGLLNIKLVNGLGGVTPNDPGDPDTGPNNLQNFPVLTLATATTISGTLDSTTANSAYPIRIEFFANAVCRNRGEAYLGSTSLAAPGGFDFNYTPVAGKTLFAAIATDANGNSSEFSACRALNTAPSFTPAAAISPQQGSSAGAAVTVGTVADAETAAGSLTVTPIAGGTATGITVTDILNTNGTITAVVTADCAAVGGTVRLQVSDGSLTGTGDLTVNVTTNAQPTLSYANASAITGNATTVTPATGPGDNGSVSTIVVQSVTPSTSPATITVNNSTGVVSVPSNVPAGSYTITIRATDNCGAFTDAPFTLNVGCPPTVATNSNDSGAGSLRQIIADACPGSVITFQAGVTTVTLTSAELLINKNLTIEGGAGVTVTRSAAGGTPSFRIFNLTVGTVAINNLTVSNGTLANVGGGILVNAGVALTCTNCTLTGNVSTANGGGGIRSVGTLVMNGCTIANNSAVTGGGASVQGSASFSDCIFSNNGGGLLSGAGTTTVNGCTFTAHTGVAIFMSNPTGILNVANSTFAGNTPTNGVFDVSSGTANLLNCTFSGNTLRNVLARSNATAVVNLKNTLLAGASSQIVVQSPGTVVSQGNNLVSDNTLPSPLASDLVNTNPLVGSFGNYGGATNTVPLLPGSPAINAGTATGAPASDQRGIARVGNVDIGAYESRGFTLTLNSGNNQSAVTSTAFANPLSVAVSSAFSEPVNGGQVTFTPPGSGASATIAGNPATIAGGNAVSGTVIANAFIGGPYNVAAGASGATSINFSLTNLNSAPTFTPAATLSRQQGSPAGAAVTVGTVSDAQTAAGSLTVTPIAGGTATGITISGIVNTGGTITAIVSADCTAVGGTVSFQVSDGNLTGTGNLQVNVSPNTAPTLAYGNVAVNAGSATTNSPTAATDNGNISSYAVQSQGSYGGTISVNASGTVSISNAAPVGNHTITIRATDNCGAFTDAQFTLSIGNNLPTITPAAALTRQQGSAGSVSTIATVSDNDTPLGNLIVNATSVPVGLTVTGISNNNGTITANITANCNATVGANTIVLTVTDADNGTSTGSLIVNVSANSAPTLTYPAADVAMNAATTVTPTGNSDNGSITGYQIVSVTPPLTTAPTINASGVISITNAAPFGTHTITVRATDNCGATTDTQFMLNVGCGTITLPSIINGLTFVPYNFTFTASGGSGSYAFTLTSGTLPPGLAFSGNTISGTPNTAGASTFTIRATDDNGCFGERSYTLLIGSTGLKYYPLARPVRLLDTRPGLSPNACFQPNAPIPGNTARLQPARGTCEGLTIPANATTITGNITTVESGGGFLTIYPSDAPQPLVANSNYQPNEILNNAFTVGVGAQDGAVKIFVTSTTDVVVDVTGYYAPPEAGGLYFHPLPRPVRLLETRSGFSGCFAPGTPLPGGANTPQLGTGSCQGLMIPPDALALVGNATTVNPAGEGYLTLYPANAAQPLIASSNYAAGQTVNGPFTVGLSPSGQFNIFTLKTTDLVVDITGYYSAQANDPNGQGLLFTSLGSPLRLLDTRAGELGCYTPGAPMTTGTVYTQETQSPCTNLTPTARALIGNATVVNTTAEGYLTFWPADATQPLVATSNYVAGQVFNRYFTVGLSGSASFRRFASRTTDLVIDISGFFAP